MKPIETVGSINMDLVSSAERIPRPGETLIGHTFHTNSGGKGANQAVAVARLGRRKPPLRTARRPVSLRRRNRGTRLPLRSEHSRAGLLASMATGRPRLAGCRCGACPVSRGHTAKHCRRPVYRRRWRAAALRPAMGCAGSAAARRSGGKQTRAADSLWLARSPHVAVGARGVRGPIFGGAVVCCRSHQGRSGGRCSETCLCLAGLCGTGNHRCDDWIWLLANAAGTLWRQDAVARDELEYRRVDAPCVAGMVYCGAREPQAAPSCEKGRAPNPRLRQCTPRCRGR